jgi:hypothetical protein
MAPTPDVMRGVHVEPTVDGPSLDPGEGGDLTLIFPHSGHSFEYQHPLTVW